MHVRHFFVVDKIKNKEVKIVCCPTETTVANYRSKLIHGELFKFQRNTILGLKKKTLDYIRNGVRKY